MELDLEDLNTVKISENDILKEALCVANRVSMNIENNRVHQVDKPSIKAEFSKNAMHYDSVAVVQRRIADRIVTLAISSMMGNRQEAISILDAGCGIVPYQLQKFVPRIGTCKSACKITCSCNGILFFNAAHLHAHVFGLQNDHHAEWI